jgi:leucyl aminopeptidase (aminopeptidase T)
MVRTSANVQPGDVVVVYGGKHTIELMEAVAAEVNKIGGMPTMFLTTDKVARARFQEMPEQYLDQEQTYFAEWLKHIDVWISVPAYENIRALWGDIPEARLAKSRKSFQVVWDMLNDAKIRLVSLGYPTEEQAAINGLDFATYKEMHWKAVNADYQQIAERGNYLKSIFQGANTVKVTSTNGTNFSFKVGDRPIFVDDGVLTKQDAKSERFLERIASLPGGAVFFAPIETSANGKVVVPRHRCRFQPLTGVAFDFKNGKLQNFKADKGADCFETTMAPYTGPKDTIGYVSIGLNPEWKVMEDPGDFRPEGAAGMVTIGVGSNELYGGNNKNTGDFSFPIVHATIEVDGRVVIKDGKLVF